MADEPERIKNIMPKVKEFDYDLWTTVEDGRKHYWAKVRSTGEITEISHEVIKYLRAEEKKAYREIEFNRNSESVLSLDELHADDEEPSWFEDHGIGMSEMETPLIEEEFRKTLTPLQLEVYEKCMLEGCGIREFARKKNIDHKTIVRIVRSIREKFTKYL